MVNYQNGKIYKLVSNHTEKVYVGSTTQSLAKRKGGHKVDYRRHLKGGGSRVSSADLFELGNVEIVLIEEFPCENKDQLYARERYWIEQLDCVNRLIPGRTNQEYYKDNRESLLVKQKQYYDNNKEKVDEYRMKYRLDRKEHLQSYLGDYYQKNRQKILERSKIYAKENRYKLEKKNERMREKITCECGLVCCRHYYLYGHKKSMTHIKRMEEKK